MRRHVTLITGAGGEIGHGLIERLAADGDSSIITIDLKPLDPGIRELVEQEYLGSILETHLLERILSEYLVDTIYHLAAILSTRAEFTPVTGHEINVEGTLKLLDFAQAQGESHGRPVAFLYPSSIAAYGLPDLETKASAGAVREHEWNNPTTMYGCNKLYCEHLGRYYALHYKQLAAETLSGKVDFRAIRFPGLISAVTVPSGGTSDYAPEMIHAAARGRGLRLLRAPRHPDPLHGDAGRRRRPGPAGPGRRRRPEARPSTTSPPSTRPRPRSATWCRPASPTRRSPSSPTSNGRRSSTAGPPMSTTAPHAQTGVWPPGTISNTVFPSS